MKNNTQSTVLKLLGLWGLNLTLYIIIALHTVHIKRNVVHFATELFKLEKNGLKVGKKLKFV